MGKSVDCRMWANAFAGDYKCCQNSEVFEEIVCEAEQNQNAMR